MGEEYVVRTEVLPLEGEIERELEGSNPTKLLKEIPSLMKQLFKIGSSSFFEDKIKWDKLGDPVEFFAQWRGKVGEDARTNFWLKVVVQGRQGLKDKRGSVTVKITGWLETEIPHETSLDKAMKLANMRMFYAKQLQEYVRRNRALIERLDMDIRRAMEAGLPEEI
ncbi:MAG: hypothetical protein QXU82_02625 [Candidatus Aenigmatarchaeota archaeon]